MHTLHSAVPRVELRPYVRAFAQREVHHASDEIIQPLTAYLEPVFEFEFGIPPIITAEDGLMAHIHRIDAVGSNTSKRSDIYLRAGVCSFGIFFQPLALWQLFHVPSSEIVDTNCDATALIGPEIEHLWNKMAAAPTFEIRVHLVESFLLKRLENARDATLILRAANYLFQHGGGPRIHDLAGRAALSVRQFERRFFNELGVTPKTFARVARFQMALDARLRSQNTSWLDLAHRFGYHDQMHMIRDFQTLGGFSPTALMEKLGDMRPPALAGQKSAEGHLL